MISERYSTAFGIRISTPVNVESNNNNIIIIIILKIRKEISYRAAQSAQQTYNA